MNLETQQAGDNTTWIKEIKDGNWVLGYDNKPFMFFMEDFEPLMDKIDIDDIIKEPIKITDEWMRKLNYTLVYRQWEKPFTKKLKDGSIRLVLEKPTQKDYPLYYMGVVVIRYVHQVQNLFDAQNNQE